MPCGCAARSAAPAAWGCGNLSESGMFSFDPRDKPRSTSDLFKQWFCLVFCSLGGAASRNVRPGGAPLSSARLLHHLHHVVNPSQFCSCGNRLASIRSLSDQRPAASEALRRAVCGVEGACHISLWASGAVLSAVQLVLSQVHALQS